jgi:ABC-2 type transport system ATP-binding protein
MFKTCLQSHRKFCEIVPPFDSCGYFRKLFKSMSISPVIQKSEVTNQRTLKNMHVIKTDKLTKRFGSLVAVDQVSFTVEEGEIFGFLGPNGAGKTTTINMLTTLLNPSDGYAEVGGLDVEKQDSKVREIVGLVPQDITVDDDLTGAENMMLHASLYHVPKNVARERIKEALGLVGLTDAAKRRVETYSGGMRKRLELAEGLIHYPKVLFLDEPTLGLDVQTRVVMWDYVKKLRDEHKITIFLTTHYMEEADVLCDRIAIIDHGKIVALDTPQNLKDSLGGDAINVEFDGAADSQIEKLKDLPLVKDIKKVGKAYMIKVPKGEEALPEIIENMLKMKLKISKVSLVKPTLDQVYLEYTGRSLRETQEGTGEMWRRMRNLRRVRG